MKHTLFILTKLLITSSAILLIGFAFLTLTPGKNTIEPANADIYSFTGLDEKNNFSRAMQSIGIKPRAFDFNGNIMYFGTTRVQNSLSARDVAEMVQDQLVSSGVNKKNYLHESGIAALSKNLSPEEMLKIQAFSSAMLTGEVLPTKKENNVYEMSGITGIKSAKAFTKNLDAKRGESLGDYSNGYRFVEIRQNPNSRSAEILAVWTDQEFVAGRMINNGRTTQSPPDPEIPACIGCKRVHRIKALSKAEPYNINHWTTNSNSFSTYSFYVHAMKNRGWKISEKQTKIDKLSEFLPQLHSIKGRSITCEKDKKAIEITITPTPNGGADVMTIEKYDNVQPILNESHNEDARTLMEEIDGIFE